MPSRVDAVGAMTAPHGHRRLGAVAVLAVLLAGAGGDAQSTPTRDGRAAARDRVELLRARMAVERASHTATRLRDGRVLLVGGWDGAAVLASAEIYDPATGAFLPTGSMQAPRAQHTATLLRDGRVLVVGGDDPRSVHATAELFDPATANFTPAASAAVARHKHAAVLLPDGRVLVLGGSDLRDWRGRLRSTEIYDPLRDRFSRGPSMGAPRFKIDGAVARSGREVVVAGGHARVEVYDPRRNRFRTSASAIGAARQFATATSLGRGRVLIVGGYDSAIRPTARAWIFVPG